MVKLKNVVRFVGLLILVPATTSLILGALFQEKEDGDLFYSISSFSFLLFYLFGRTVINKIFAPQTNRDYLMIWTVGYLLTVMVLYLIIYFNH